MALLRLALLIAVMASLFAVLGSSLQPDGLQPGRKRLAARTSTQPFMCQKILRVLAGAAAVTAAVTGDTQTAISRNCYRKKHLGELEEEALTFKQREFGESTRSWKIAFLHQKYGEMNSSQLKSKLGELRAALRKDGGTKNATRRLAASSKPLSRCRPENLAAFCVGKTKSAMQPKSRCRESFDKWRGSAELDAELWAWFVDRLATNMTRVSSREIQHVATQYSNAVLRDWKSD